MSETHSGGSQGSDQQSSAGSEGDTAHTGGTTQGAAGTDSSSNQGTGGRKAASDGFAGAESVMGGRGSTTSDDACDLREQRSCTCDNGKSGIQKCGEDLVYAECVCAAEDDDDSGCGCTVPGRPRYPSSIWLAGLLAGLVGFARRGPRPYKDAKKSNMA